MKSKIKSPTFRELLERNTNLLTVIAIFNALTIYAQSINNPSKSFTANALPFVFLLLSMVVLAEVIRDFLSSLSHKYVGFLFSFLLIFCEYGLGKYVFEHYTGELTVITSTAIVLSLLFIYFDFILPPVNRFKINKYIRATIKVILFLILMFLGWLFSVVIAVYSVDHLL